MNEQKRFEQAARWFSLCRDDARAGDVGWFGKLRRRLRRKAFQRWLRSEDNLVAFLRIAAVDATLSRCDLTERSCEAVSSNVVPLRARELPSRPMTLIAAQPGPRTLMSRRSLVATFGGFVMGGIGMGALKSVISSGREDLVASGHLLKVALRDGVMLAARNSAFRIYPLTGAHTVQLSTGQAAFQLRTRLRAFTRVTTPLAEILAATARFSVVALDSLLELAVAEGSVRILGAAFGRSGHVLRAGQKLTLRLGADRASIVQVDAEHQFAWVRGDLYFDGDESLEEVAATFNRFNELQILASPEVADLRVATLQASLSEPQRFVERFATDWNLATRRQGKRILIFKRDEQGRP